MNNIIIDGIEYIQFIDQDNYELIGVFKLEFVEIKKVK